jgi:hypothetical protein
MSVLFASEKEQLYQLAKKLSLAPAGRRQTRENSRAELKKIEFDHRTQPAR